jgi:hypothetical protein
MANDTKTAKADPAPKAETVPKATVPKAETAAKDKAAPGETASKAEGGDTTAAAPANYSRGEGQKPVTQAYKDNWNAIFAKGKTKRKKR